MSTMMLSDLEKIAGEDFSAASRLALGRGYPPPLFRLPDGRSVVITAMEIKGEGPQRIPRLILTYDEWKPAHPSQTGR